MHMCCNCVCRSDLSAQALAPITAAAFNDNGACEGRHDVRRKFRGPGQRDGAALGTEEARRPRAPGEA